MPRLTLLLLPFCLFLIGASAQAQNAAISGFVRSSGTGVDAGTVTLLNAADSSWVRSELSGKDGRYTIKSVPDGNYIVLAVAMGYNSARKAVSVKDIDLPGIDFELARESTGLKEVAVTAIKPFIEMSIGKVSVNVEGSPTAVGSNALELMRRAPGVTVDMNGTISLSGKQEVLVLIDDRPTYLSGTQLAEYLKTISSDEVAQLEVITQPSAKYDAAGNGGVINVKTIKSRGTGITGNSEVTYGQGVYPFFRAGSMLNYKFKKLNVSWNGSEQEATGFANWKQTQQFTDGQTGAILGTTKIHSSPVERFGIATMKLGVDYEVSSNTTVGGSIRGAYHPNTMQSHVDATKTSVPRGDIAHNTIGTTEGFIRKDAVMNAFLSHKFSQTNSLDMNFDYLTYGNFAWQNIKNNWYDGQMQPNGDPLLLNSVQPTLINVRSVKVDDVFELKNGLHVETGLKGSSVATDNNSEFTIFSGGQWQDDTSRSNHFWYKEGILAGYITCTKEITKKCQLRLGLRGEETIADGKQFVKGETFSRSYFSLFPTVFITYKHDSDNQFEINYGRRIQRPEYRWLNPFIYYSFEYNYSVGNPGLQPQFTNDIEVKHSYKNMLISSASLSRTTGVMDEVLDVNNAGHIVYRTMKNLATTTMGSYSMTFNKEFFKTWSLNVSGNVCYAYYTTVLNGQDVKRQGFGSSTTISNQFNFSHGWKAEAMAYLSGRAVWSTTERALATNFMQFGLSKKASEALTIKFAATDPFYLYKLTIIHAQSDYNSTASFQQASQRFDLSLTWNFGKGTANKHSEHQPEETNRMHVD